MAITGCSSLDEESELQSSTITNQDNNIQTVFSKRHEFSNNIPGISGLYQTLVRYAALFVSHSLTVLPVAEDGIHDKGITRTNGQEQGRLPILITYLIISPTI